MAGARTRRSDDTVLMARFVWSVVHGVAMLSIDGQLREPGGVEELMRYALKRCSVILAILLPRLASSMR